MDKKYLIEQATCKLSEKGISGKPLALCLQELGRIIDSKSKQAPLILGKDLSIERYVYDFLDHISVFVGYDNPILAREVCDLYEKEEVIPSDQIEVTVKNCSTVKDLVNELNELDAKYGISEIFGEYAGLRSTTSDYKRISKPSRIDESSGSWSNMVRSLEEK